MLELSSFRTRSSNIMRVWSLDLYVERHEGGDWAVRCCCQSWTSRILIYIVKVFYYAHVYSWNFNFFIHCLKYIFMYVLFSIFVCVFLQLMDKILSKKIKDENLELENFSYMLVRRQFNQSWFLFIESYEATKILMCGFVLLSYVWWGHIYLQWKWRCYKLRLLFFYFHISSRIICIY